MQINFTYINFVLSTYINYNELRFRRFHIRR